MNIDGHFSEALRRVSVEKDIVVAADVGDVIDGLDGPDFVVDVHNAAQNGIGSNGLFDGFGIDDAVFLGIYESDLMTPAFDFLHRLQGGFMLER